MTNSTVSEQLHRRLLDRLHLRDVVYTAEEPLPQRLSHGHLDVDGDGDPEDAMPILGLEPGRKTIAFGWTDGGIVATARALARWGQALYDGDALAPRWRKEMLTFRASERGHEYGLGVQRDRGLRGTRVRVGHDGDNLGYRAELRHYPDAGVTVAILWTDATVPFGLLENDVAQVVLDHLDNANG